VSYHTANEIGTALCNQLGIDPSTVTSITLHCHVGDVARVTVEHNVFSDGDLHQIVEGYELKRIES